MEFTNCPDDSKSESGALTVWLTQSCWQPEILKHQDLKVSFRALVDLDARVSDQGSTSRVCFGTFHQPGQQIPLQRLSTSLSLRS